MLKARRGVGSPVPRGQPCPALHVATLQENLKCVFLEMPRLQSLHGFNIKDMKNWRKLGDRASPEAPEWVSLGRWVTRPPTLLVIKSPGKLIQSASLGKGKD